MQQALSSTSLVAGFLEPPWQWSELSAGCLGAQAERGMPGMHVSAKAPGPADVLQRVRALASLEGLLDEP